MYPELTLPLVVAFALAAGLMLFLIVFRPVLRRLAVRQVVRRPAESVLVVLGSVLGTALIVASLTVGDSLDRSVRQVAYDVLGPIDQTVRSPSVELGDEVAQRLDPLRDHPNVDGVLTARTDSAAATFGSGNHETAEPRVLVWELDYEQARQFGAPDESGLDVGAVEPGEVVINEHLAEALGAGVGGDITFFIYEEEVQATVSAVVPAEGLAGTGLGSTVNRNAFLPEGTLVDAAAAQSTDTVREPTTFTYISNRGDVEGGVEHTDEVVGEINARLGPLTEAGTWVETAKQDVLDEAEETGAMLGSLFLFVASFSIIAGILLITNIFVMLAEERRGQLGTLRAIGMRRRRVSAALAIEGALYSGVAVVLGAALGVLLGRIVAVLAGNIFNSWNQADNKLEIVFAVSPVSIINGMTAGFLIALIAVALTSIRIARANVIAAIRDLEPSPRQRTRNRLSIVSAVAAGLLAIPATMAVIRGDDLTTYLYPALVAVVAMPFLRRFWPARTVYTGVALGVLIWGLTASLFRPGVFDDPSTGIYIVMGTMLTFGAVVLISQHQGLLLRPLRRLIQQPSQRGLASRLAVAYPTAKRFRTGATLAMYTIVVLVIVMLTQISAVLDAGVENEVDKATGEWSLRADYNPSARPDDLERTLTSARFSDGVTSATELTTAPALGDDPKGRGSDALPVIAVGVSARLVDDPPSMLYRLPELTSDAEAWNLVLDDPRYALIDGFYGSQGGPPGEPVMPGQVITLTDPLTGEEHEVTVAGVLNNGLAFFGLGGAEFRYPVLMSQPAVQEVFGDGAAASSVMLRLAQGADSEQVIGELQATFLTNGMVVTDIAQSVRNDFASSRQFFLLMQGYLALGLVVGITGLGVVMVRAVRERRHTIAVLRALGFQARTVRRSFLTESGFIAFEGVLIGTLLGVATTWLFYQNSAAFAALDASYPIAWGAIALTVGGTLVASLLVTFAPARRAARIHPAVALRVVD